MFYSRALIVAALLLLSFGCSSSQDSAVAFVDSAPITRWEMDQMVRSLAKAANKKIESLTPQERREAMRTSLEELIAEKLLLAEARRMEIKDVSPQIAKFREAHLKKLGGEEALQAELKADGLSPKQFDSRLEVMVLKTMVLQNWAAKLPSFSPLEAKIFFESHSDLFKGMTLEKAEPLIVASLSSQRRQADMEQNMLALAASANVTVRDPELKEIYDTAVAEKRKRLTERK